MTNKYLKDNQKLIPQITQWIPQVTEIVSVIPVPIALVLAIIHTESSGNPNASLVESTSNTSIGLMAVCTKTAQWIASDQGKEVLKAKGMSEKQLAVIPPFLNSQDMFYPSTNLWFGIVYLYYQYLRYKNWQDAVAAYNAGSVRKRNGYYINQSYVKKVFIRFEMYKNYLKTKEAK